MKKSKNIIIALALILILVGAYKVFYKPKKATAPTNNVKTSETSNKKTQKQLPRQDIPIYPSGVVRYVVNTDTGFSAGVKLKSTINSKEVLQYYLDTLPQEGWKLESKDVFVSLTIKAHKEGKTLFVVMSSANDKQGYWTYVIEVK